MHVSASSRRSSGRSTSTSRQSRDGGSTRRRLRDDDGLAREGGPLPTHPVGSLEADISEQRLPLAAAEHRAVLPCAFGVSALTEEPPAVCEAKGDLRKDIRLEALIGDEEPTRAEQLVAVAERPADVRRRVQAVGGDHEVNRARAKALQRRVGVDVEQRVAENPHMASNLVRACSRKTRETSVK